MLDHSLISSTAPAFRFSFPSTLVDIILSNRDTIREKIPIFSIIVWFRRGIDFPLQSSFKNIGHVSGCGMYLLAHYCNPHRQVLSFYRLRSRELHIIGNYALGDWNQRLLGPRRVPIKGTAIHQGREFPTPNPQGVSHRGHAEHYMQVISHSLNKGFVNSIRVSRTFHMPFRVVPVFVYNFSSLIWLPEVGYFPGIQRIVDIF